MKKYCEYNVDVSGGVINGRPAVKTTLAPLAVTAAVVSMLSCCVIMVLGFKYRTRYRLKLLILSIISLFQFFLWYNFIYPVWFQPPMSLLMIYLFMFLFVPIYQWFCSMCFSTVIIIIVWIFIFQWHLHKMKVTLN